MKVNKTQTENNFPDKDYKYLYDKYWKYKDESPFISEQVELDVLDQIF